MKARGFTLAEVMIALLFISIALFGYVSLHIRVIHSGYKVGLRQLHHEKASEKVGRAMWGEKRVKRVYIDPNKPFDYLPGSELETDPPAMAPPFTVPAGVKYLVVEEQWKDRQGNQIIVIDTCKGPIMQGWEGGAPAASPAP